jgi:hypothetical protein
MLACTYPEILRLEHLQPGLQVRQSDAWGRADHLYQGRNV